MQAFLTLTLLMVSSSLAFPGYGYHAPPQLPTSAGLQPLQYQAYGQHIVEPIIGISKQYHVYSAPEEEFEEVLPESFLTLKKNLRVLFIKAPENNGLSRAISHLSKQVTEDKTAIYVLSKQHDIHDFAHQIQEIKEVHSHKPEVHFIKYKTPEEAELAKANIQSVYDSLGGTSEVTHEGLVPVHDFSGSVPTVATLPTALPLPVVSTVSSGSASSISPGLGYLPPAKH